MRVLMRRFWRSECGQDMVEWAILVALVAIGSAALMSRSGGSISNVWTATNVTLQGQSVNTTSPTTGGGDSGHDGDHRDGDGH
jgi:Flp pilus assembly pilin Flp